MTRTFAAVIGAVVLFTFLAAASVLAGYAAEGWNWGDFNWQDDFSWDVAAIVGTALGTTTLALATLVLAVGTRQLARTAEKQVAVEQASLAAGVRPLLLNVPPGYGAQPGFVPASEAIGRMGAAPVSVSRDGEAYRVVLPVRNAGVGVAFVNEAFVSWKGESYGGRARNPIIPPKELTDLIVVDLPNDGEFESPEETRRFAVAVVYEDLGGKSWQTSIDVKWREKAGGWMVIAVECRATGAPDDQAVKSGDMWEE